jgi:hypothetical protein
LAVANAMTILWHHYYIFSDWTLKINIEKIKKIW